MKKIKQALISVSNKDNLKYLIRSLKKFNINLISSGGTYKEIKRLGFGCEEVSKYTNSSEILSGRVKTLHPKIHAGILSKRDSKSHQKDLEKFNFKEIDLVIANFYPFGKTISQTKDQKKIIENIDIGGPTMIRAAAKNHPRVAVVTDPGAYSDVLSALSEHDGATTLELRERLAGDAFLHTAQYDSAIAEFLKREPGTGQEFTPMVWGEPLERSQTLRYGENPHQAAGLYLPSGRRSGLALATQVQGKALSYNNWLDMDGAFCLARDLGPNGVAVIKHTNPCGAARSNTSLLEAYRSARSCDPTSSFGGIVASRGIVDASLARELVETFLEVVIAGGVTPEARDILSAKKRLRVLVAEERAWEVEDNAWLPRPIAGAMLVQQADTLIQDIRECQVATERHPTEEEWLAMEFGWMVVKHVKSNAIVFTRSDRTVGIGAGQMSRVDSSKIAVMKAQSSLEGTAVSSDAFFPFADGVEAAAEAGATAIIQPGGSIRDAEVIEAANRLGLTMVFTGHRHFKH